MLVAMKTILATASLALFLFACGGPSQPPQGPGGPGMPPQGGPQGPGGPGGGPGGAGMANPASQNCRAKGGRLEIRADQKGNETGFCVFPDGSVCDEWAFMDGKCAPGQHR